jgi:pyridoxine kinase
VLYVGVMARVLILSSFVAASRVGGGAQALTLARLGIEPVLVPTVLFGRHPGHGPPGGGPVAPDTFEAMLRGVAAQGHFRGLDAVITGHFSSAEQVAVAAETLARVKAASPGAWLVVDPIMGDDETGLYVREPVAEAIAAELVRVADILAPNAWELGRLAGQAVQSPASALAAARALGRDVLASSIREDGVIGALYAGGGSAVLATHAISTAAPKGTGDLLTAVFVAALVRRRSGPDALEIAVGAVAEGVAMAAGRNELPLEALPTALAPSPRVSLRRLDG